MKKVIALLLALVMVFALCACGDSQTQTGPGSASTPGTETTPGGEENPPAVSVPLDGSWPEETIKIGVEAFDQAKVQTVTFAPNSKVSYIGEDAFNECAITEITIPTSVETIGSNAFKGCTGLIILLGYDAAGYGQASAKWANDWHGDTPYSFSGGDSEVQIDDNFKGIYFEEYGVVYIMEYIGSGEELVLQGALADAEDELGAPVELHVGVVLGHIGEEVDRGVGVN